MHAVRILFRRLAGALVALTLAMFVVAPSLDALICGDEGAVASAASTSSADQLAKFDDGGVGHADSVPHQPCVHGHCHHGFQYVPVAVAEAPVSEAGTARHVWPTPVRLATLAPSSLERPPRA